MKTAAVAAMAILPSSRSTVETIAVKPTMNKLSRIVMKPDLAALQKLVPLIAI